MKIRVLNGLLREAEPALVVVGNEDWPYRTIRILGPSVLVQVGKQAWIETEADIETE